LAGLNRKGCPPGCCVPSPVVQLTTQASTKGTVLRARAHHIGRPPPTPQAARTGRVGLAHTGWALLSCRRGGGGVSPQEEAEQDDEGEGEEREAGRGARDDARLYVGHEVGPGPLSQGLVAGGIDGVLAEHEAVPVGCGWRVGGPGGWGAGARAFLEGGGEGTDGVRVPCKKKGKLEAIQNELCLLHPLLSPVEWGRNRLAW
jgi:hypothetical protein